MTIVKSFGLQDLVGMSFKDFQNRYSVLTDPGPFERRLYLGSNEMLEDAYQKLGDVKGVGISVLGGVDQTLTMIASSKTDFNIMLDVNPRAVKYGNIRVGLTQLANNAVEYIQRLTSRPIPPAKMEEFINAVNGRGYSGVREILRGLNPDPDYFAETYRLLKEKGFVVDPQKAIKVLAIVAKKTGYSSGHISDLNEKERSMQLFFEFFENNPSNWLFDREKYADIQARVSRGEIKIIQENIFESTVAHLSGLLEQAGLVLGFFYDSNTLYYQKSEKIPKLQETMMRFPRDEDSLWISCDSAGNATVKTISEALKDAKFMRSVKGKE